jgi:hypothetical protein
VDVATSRAIRRDIGVALCSLNGRVDRWAGE